MLMNFTAIFVSALIPLMVGAIWYHPKVMGTLWMRLSGTTEEQIRSGNMVVIFVVTYLLSVLLAITMNYVVIHQADVYSILVDEPGFMEEGSELMIWLNDFMDQYGNNFRSFKHGAFHGVLQAVFFALPVFGINALFERRPWGYIWLHLSYWVISLALMGGILCAWI